MRILITGATGLIGREVGKVLAEKGHQIFVVSRDSVKAREILPFPCEVIVGDLNNEILRDERLKDIEAVINLMGETVVGGRWTAQKKDRIYRSRVVGTKNLVASLPQNLKCFISGSAVGIYGERGSELAHEIDAPGADFLAKVCVDWEAEAQKASGRVALIRTGVVLAPHGGALEEMLFPFRVGVGGAIGDGSQWMSWIHLQDIVGLFVFALENEQVRGPVNGVAPTPVTNKDFSKSLAKALGKGLGPSVPLLALKLLFGEGAQVVTSSLRGSAKKAFDWGYQFKYTDLDKALSEICTPYRNGEDVFYAEQFIASPPEQVFTFFKDPFNLEKITPSSLNFHIEKVSEGELRQGTLIDYTLKIRGVPAKWKTILDEWKPPYRFVDNQLKGPYKLWHHTHEFRPFCGGTLMVDRVRYSMPMGFLGWLVAGKFVRKEIQHIFSYRRQFVAHKGLS